MGSGTAGKDMKAVYWAEDLWVRTQGSLLGSGTAGKDTKAVNWADV